MTVATFTHSLDIDPAPYVRRDERGLARLELAVKGMRCSGCIAKIERGLKALPGVEDARVNLSSAKVSVRWREGRTNGAAIVRRVGELGFQAFPYDPAAILNREDEEGRFLLRCLAVAGFAASNVMFLSISIWSGLDGEMGEATRTLLHWLSGLVAFPAAIYSGRPFFYSAFESQRRGQANMDVPISIAIVLALALSVWETVHGGRYAYFDAAVSLPFLLLIGRYLDHVLRRKAHETARDLIAMQTSTATRLDANGVTCVVAPGDIAPGDRLLIAAGERLPVDAMVEQGESDADVSLVTGETGSVRVQSGSTLNAGSLILGQSLVVRATARAQDSLVAEIARLLEAGQQNRNRYVGWADRAACLYVPCVHGAALAVFFGGMLFGVDAGAALTNAIALLIITCPCALGLAVPAVQIAATSRLFRRGLLVKSGDALERLADADTVVFDKTGTLTRGVPVLSSTTPMDRSMLARAAQLARASKHPFAQAIAEAAGPGAVANGVTETAGEGLEGEIGGHRARLGRASWVGVGGTAEAPSTVWYAEQGMAPSHFEFTDEVRADAHSTVKALRDRGLNVQMLSGDRNVPASAIALQCEIEAWRAATSPTEKVAHLERLRGEGRRVLMVGDGLNDAAALAAAHVSISPGTGANVSQAAADMVLTAERLFPIVDAIDVARAARRLVLQNFAFAALYNVLAVPLAATGQVTPLIAAIAMSASSILVMLNASRLAAKD
jgi:Cu2+-exporting ATPase